jgi:beta-lactamase class A
MPAHPEALLIARPAFLAGLASIAFARPACADASAAREAVEGIAATIPGRVAVYARELSGREETIALDADELFPAASVVKLAIMLTAYRAIEDGRIALSTPVAFAAGDVVGGSETFGDARAGESAPLGALLRAMIRQSDNCAANALVDRFGFATINGVIARAGLHRTHLRRYFMYFSKAHENVTTARDIGTLLFAIERGARGDGDALVSARSCRAMIDTLLGQEDREKIAPGLPRGVPLANKTGELPGARHDAGIVDPYGPRPYVLVVLEKNLDDQDVGVRGITRISRSIYRSFGTAAPSDEAHQQHRSARVIEREACHVADRSRSDAAAMTRGQEKRDVGAARFG